MQSVATAAIVCGAASCYEGPPAHVPQPDEVEFAERVYPILLRDCGFAKCHGDSTRYFKVYGPGRTRLHSETRPLAPATTDEIELSYGRTRAMLASAHGVEESPLLRKPTEGAGHAGLDEYGRNVYTATDPSLAVMTAWARGEALP